MAAIHAKIAITQQQNEFSELNFLVSSVPARNLLITFSPIAVHYSNLASYPMLGSAYKFSPFQMSGT
ncbi:hypothetical protein IQ273_32670 [Nodosilinea sp. LEGE 07298]|uniref:hypothetical protein n=1 Tax=Nodosilinea sp. LEGE 07298 TaxID=2777970 RepID=UPI00187E00B6|nr:hypothetical protein [Nodosilinea sp. LEGE 07298]MBE9114121.1 hypothetical protein [Nodosilinea sp. LEGE 07298]